MKTLTLIICVLLFLSCRTQKIFNPINENFEVTKIEIFAVRFNSNPRAAITNVNISERYEIYLLIEEKNSLDSLLYKVNNLEPTEDGFPSAKMLCKVYLSDKKYIEIALTDYYGIIINGKQHYKYNRELFEDLYYFLPDRYRPKTLK